MHARTRSLDRAVLTLLAAGDPAQLDAHLHSFAGHPRLLASFVTALTVAAEETEALGTAAAGFWPTVVPRVLVALASSAGPPAGGDADDALAALLPGTVTDGTYFAVRELAGEAVQWTTGVDWPSLLQGWLPVAASGPRAVDALIRRVETLPPGDQVGAGLAWIAKAARPATFVARRSYRLPDWLIATRERAFAAGRDAVWLSLVDDLVIAGDSSLAAYAD